MAKVKLGLTGLSPDELVGSANTTKTAMTGNANFTTPNPTLATFGTAITAVATKINAYNSARAAAETALADRDAAVDTLRSLYTQLGDYVQNITAGDKTKIESAGMAIRADNAPVNMTRVLDLVVSEGDNPGTLDFVCKPVRGAKIYEVHISLGDPNVEANWTFKTSASASNGTLDCLTSGIKVWVRLRAIGGNNQKGPYSDPATKIVP